jgi:hypothetical protein
VSSSSLEVTIRLKGGKKKLSYRCRRKGNQTPPREDKVRGWWCSGGGGGGGEKSRSWTAQSPISLALTMGDEEAGDEGAKKPWREWGKASAR